MKGTQWLGRQYNASQEERWLWIFIYGLILEQHLENNKIFIIRIQIAWLEKKLLNCTVHRMLRLSTVAAIVVFALILFVCKGAKCKGLPIFLTGTLIFQVIYSFQIHEGRKKCCSMEFYNFKISRLSEATVERPTLIKNPHSILGSKNLWFWKMHYHRVVWKKAKVLKTK